MTIRIPVCNDGREIELELDERVFCPSVASTSLLHAVSDEDIQGKKVFDLGVGTGYLGLGTLRRGASSLYGIDIDSLAVDLTKRNANLNDLGDRCDIFIKDMRDEIDEDFDVIISNPPLMPSELERRGYGPDSSTSAGDGSKYAIRVLEIGSKSSNPNITVYLPVFSFSNPNKIFNYAKSTYNKVDVVARHEIIFDISKLVRSCIFKEIYAQNKGRPIEVHGHPYWRIDILRCQK